MKPTIWVKVFKLNTPHAYVKFEHYLCYLCDTLKHFFLVIQLDLLHQLWLLQFYK